MKEFIIILFIILNVTIASSQVLEIYEEAKDKIDEIEANLILEQEKISNAEQKKEFEEDTKKTLQIKKQKEKLEELKELTGKISKGIKRYSVIKTSIEHLKNTLVLYTSLSKKFKASENISSEQLKQILDILYSSVNAQEECIKNIKIIFNTDKTKMSEAQRVKLLYKEEKKMQLNYNKLKKIESSLSVNRFNYL